ncbi:hypothetical protein PLESTB_000006900 [Pleodorina starrii]|uniref:Uncharacterized protein n=1 Tax=Pleodorina starrii TaxID=330485 RepID=A0A9W6EX41_9CHLO|nr:hypothetical protein PLESTM_000840300 [Pleodorina starrii]GLC47611.1 hypothetical protein PLESTB_000006900 [Pleodorina starrii]GLC75619.1 hypothetical protein PLESTF_001665900 [Pleodorina starrii]
MASTMTLQEALGHVDELAKELSFYDGGIYKQIQEQTVINKCKDTLEKVKTVLMAKEPDGSLRADRLSTSDWRRIAGLMAPLARCFAATSPSPVAPTAKTRHASSQAVAALALLSSCNTKSKIIVTSALENGVVDAFVATLRNSLRNPVSDRVVKAMLYKLIEALWGFTLYATSQHQQDMVAKDVVNVCIDLVTASSVETESKLNASKTLYNCLVASSRAVTELRTSKVQALNAQLQQLAGLIPDPASAAGLLANGGGGGGGGGGAKAISMPVMLSAFMSWIWFLPHYILDHLMDSLSRMLARLVVLAWPEGAPGIPLLEPGREEPLAGPLQVAQLSLPNRALRNTMQTLFKTIASGLADPRLVGILRGARLPAPAGAADAAADDAAAAAARLGTGLPARLVRVVREGRPDGVETKVALELLDELFACDADGGHPELADDALAAGLLASMTEMGVLDALRTEAGLQGVVAFVRLAFKLVKRAPYTPGLPARLHDSGVPASVAYLAFMPATRVSLKLEALQTLREIVQLDTDMTEHVVSMNNFPMALTNTLLGGDPDGRKPAGRPQTKKSGGGSSKKKGGAAAAAAAATTGAAAAAAAAAADMSGPNAGRGPNHRDQMQEVAFDILTVVLDAARESDKVWETVVESGMLPRLVQHSCAFPMQPSLLAELLLAVGLTFRDHREDTASVGGLQAACAPHMLPLLLHDEPVVAGAAARVLKDILLDMARYRADSADVAEGDEILKALVAAGAAIDNADAAAARAAAAAAAAAAVAAAGMEAVPEVMMADASAVAGKGAEPVKAELGAAVVVVAAAAQHGSAGSPAAADLQRSAALGTGAMDVDVPAASTVAHDAPAATSPGTGGGAAAAGDAAAASTAAALEPEVPELIDVTAHGLGLVCAAMQSCIATVLQRPRAGAATPASASPPAGAGAAASAAPAVSTASSPMPGPAAAAAAAATAAATSTSGPVAIVLDGPAYESLEALLLSCRVLGEACLQMPPHGLVRRHLARALAYAKPSAEELAAALGALVDPEPGHEQLLADTREMLAVLGKIPVLDTALLPKPKPEEEEEARDMPPAPVSNGVARKGRPTGSGKRASQGNLAADGTQQPGQQPNKRQRTASASAAAAAAAVAVAPEGTDDMAPGTLVRGRSATLTASPDCATTGSPRTSARQAAAAAAAAATAASAAAAVNGAAGPADAPPLPPPSAVAPGAPAAAAPGAGSGPSECRNGAEAQPPPGPRRGFPEGLPPLLPPGKGRAAAAGGSASGNGAAALARSGSEVPGAAAAGAAGAGGGGAAVPAVPAAPPVMGGAAGLELPLPSGLRPVKTHPPAAHGQAAPRPGALAESPNASLEKRANSLSAPGSATAAAAAAAPLPPPPGSGAAAAAAATSSGGGGADGGAPKGRLSAAEFRARYLDMKEQNAKMASELELLRAAKEEAEAAQRTTAEALASRTGELAQSRQELVAKDAELARRAEEAETLRQQLAAARAELTAAREAAAEATAAVSGATAGLRELEQLRAENAELKAELANLADLE